jgi:hypothetical protein
MHGFVRPFEWTRSMDAIPLILSMSRHSSVSDWNATVIAADVRRRKVAPPPEPDDYGMAEHQDTEFSEDDFAPSESGQHSTASDSETLQPATPAPELADPIRRKDVASADQVIEPMPPDESAQGQHASNTYPALPAPPPEYSQEDASDAVLRLITRSA